ncbi:hypothetical protein [Paenirhodobacter enshiensis]|uniref:hypothetical protein n=1 Tax=Paenirhodobacter enshiensis TaxID=1105367 RepID=UPI003FA33AA3
MFRFVSAAFAVSAMSGAAFAADEVSFIVVQNTLVDHGYLEANPDRYESPQMTAAMEGFSKDYGGSPTVDGVLSTMMGLAMKNRTEVSDRSLLAKVEKAVGEQLRDPDSVKLRNVYIERSPRSELICGEVNGKNAYGGYAGFTTFYGLLAHGSEDVFQIAGIDGAGSSTALLTCATTFPQKQ